MYPRTLIFCTSYFQPRLHNKTGARWVKWYKYYQKRLTDFGAERLIIIDDASPIKLIPKKFERIPADKKLPTKLPETPIIFRFSKHLGRQSIGRFPGWWRSFTFASVIAIQYGYDKLIHLESDAYITSRRFAEYLKQTRSGWLSPWCYRWNFPEPAIQVICESSIRKLNKFYTNPKQYWYSEKYAEHVLPFKRMPTHFKGDRYGEYMKSWPRKADYVCQALNRWSFDESWTPIQSIATRSRKN